MSRVQQVGQCGNCGGAVVLDYETFEGWGGSWKVPALRCVKCRGLARWPVLEMRERRRGSRAPREAAKQ